jgi:hypothetical protein
VRHVLLERLQLLRVGDLVGLHLTVAVGVELQIRRVLGIRVVVGGLAGGRGVLGVVVLGVVVLVGVVVLGGVVVVAVVVLDGVVVVVGVVVVLGGVVVVAVVVFRRGVVVVAVVMLGCVVVVVAVVMLGGRIVVLGVRRVIVVMLGRMFVVMFVIGEGAAETESHSERDERDGETMAKTHGRLGIPTVAAGQSRSC